jgi:hypothetical protein
MDVLMDGSECYLFVHSTTFIQKWQKRFLPCPHVKGLKQTIEIHGAYMHAICAFEHFS